MEYSTSIIEVKGVGDKTKALFRKLNIETVGDLLEHYPRDYDVFEKPVAISQVKNGVNAIYACVRSVISEKKIRKLNILSFSAADQSGQIQITFFNMPFLKKTLKPGQFYVFRGNIQKKGSIISMDQPKIYSKEDYDKLCHILQPRYSLTKGLTNLTIQKTVKKILEDFAFDEEYYPDDLIKKYDLIGEREAYLQLHFPNTPDSLQRARKRLVFDEFFTFLYLLRLCMVC